MVHHDIRVYHMRSGGCGGLPVPCRRIVGVGHVCNGQERAVLALCQPSPTVMQIEWSSARPILTSNHRSSISSVISLPAFVRICPYRGCHVPVRAGGRRVRRGARSGRTSAGTRHYHHPRTLHQHQMHHQYHGPSQPATSSCVSTATTIAVANILVPEAPSPQQP